MGFLLQPRISGALATATSATRITAFAAVVFLLALRPVVPRVTGEKSPLHQ